VAALRQEHVRRRTEIRQRLEEFRRVVPEEYFYELVYCLLTPQTSAEHADRVIFSLRAAGFRERGFDPEREFRHASHYIRFHRTKARHVQEARQKFPEIEAALRVGRPALEMRDWLVRNVKGLGYKEATHFLRNIGRNEGLAILDRHILRHLRKLGVIRSVPQSLTGSRYLKVERRFQEFADQVGIPVDELDLLFWSLATGSIRK